MKRNQPKTLKTPHGVTHGAVRLHRERLRGFSFFRRKEVRGINLSREEKVIIAEALESFADQVRRHNRLMAQPEDELPLRPLEKLIGKFERQEKKFLQKRLGVTDKDVWGMIKVLIKAGYGKSAFAFLTQSGQMYSFAFDDIRADMWNSGEIKL